MNTGNMKINRLLLPALLVAITFIVYSNTLSNAFVYDDNFQILKNPWITDFKYLPRIFTADSYGYMEEGYRTSTYRPMLFTVYAVEYALFGLKSWGWHLFNVFFHAANSVAVFFTLSVLLRKGREGTRGTISAYLPPFIGALIFTVHPVNSEAVAWVGCVPELLYTFLCLLSFYLYVSEEGKKGVTLGKAASVFFFFAAAFFKETAAALPVLIFVYDSLTKKDENVISFEKVKRYLPYFLAGVVYLAIRFYAVGGMAPGYKMHGYLSGPQQVLNIFPLFIKYLAALVLPLTYHPIQPLDPVFSLFEARALLSVLATISIPAVVFIFRKRLNPLFFLSFAIIVIPLLPGLYAYSISITPFSDRYLYFPTVGYALSIALILKEASVGRNRAAFWGAAAVFIVAAVFYSALSVGRNAVWRDELSLWSASYSGSKDNYIALYSLGNVYLKNGMTEESVPMLKEALRLNTEKKYPDLSTLYLTRRSLAEAYSKKGLTDELIKEYLEILRIKPDDAFVSYNLAVIYQSRGLLNDSIGLYKNALLSVKKPRQRKDILNNIGVCYAGLGMWDEALSSYSEALKYSPGDPLILSNIKAASEKGTRGFQAAP